MKTKEPLQKLAYAWIFVMFIVILLLALYLFKTEKCVSNNFYCNKLYIRDTQTKIQLVNNLHDVEVFNLTASCNINRWSFNNKKEADFKFNEDLDIELICNEPFKNLNITLFYNDPNTNITHTDLITIRR